MKKNTPRVLFHCMADTCTTRIIIRATKCLKISDLDLRLRNQEHIQRISQSKVTQSQKDWTVCYLDNSSTFERDSRILNLDIGPKIKRFSIYKRPLINGTIRMTAFH